MTEKRVASQIDQNSTRPSQLTHELIGLQPELEELRHALQPVKKVAADVSRR